MEVLFTQEVISVLHMRSGQQYARVCVCVRAGVCVCTCVCVSVCPSVCPYVPAHAYTLSKEV